MPRSFFHKFSSRSFIVSSLTFNSLIHFELSFVSVIVQGSIFILLNVNIKFLKNIFPH